MLDSFYRVLLGKYVLVKEWIKHLQCQALTCWIYGASNNRSALKISLGISICEKLQGKGQKF